MAMWRTCAKRQKLISNCDSCQGSILDSKRNSQPSPADTTNVRNCLPDLDWWRMHGQCSHLKCRGILTHKGYRIFYRITFSVVVEISPNPNCTTFSDTVRPDSQFFCGIIVPVRLPHAVETNVDIIGCPNQLIRKLRAANGAKNGTSFAKSSKDCLIPPTGVAELYDVAPIMVELEQNGL